ncbi:transcriptional regulator, TetR family [Catenulispora acidiphila DSM 44928]|uniref:Transcriptional regulator, TetR family n=1 Tax=Catenulispora acidiphila (strain DSM 44928 / JCM 14897 / NBRC 102108 / NRRL B-24433 / ID139908) TaxID=479433 RepID=C7Q8Y3_CATAD|nr:TetR/AcrR family transcriptional regulator [Catenulispora acidiphila]ACU72303.1 transcriptional regulator, TetR family [Catenulispora acidiphila DSM 44928]
MVSNGLRERKRAATRQRVSDCATRLFERDGFENVTLAQVAEAADVSVKTVTNYFGAKEDLFFDAEPAILEALVDALRERAAASPTSALRPLVLDGPVLTAPRPWAEVDAVSWDGMRIWSRCEHDSPTLRTRRAAILQSWSDPLAAAGGSVPWAALMVGALILRHDLLQKGLLEGAAPAEVERRVKDGVGQALDALERGFGQVGD